jgi:hypothetical protein
MSGNKGQKQASFIRINPNRSLVILSAMIEMPFRRPIGVYPIASHENYK